VDTRRSSAVSRGYQSAVMKSVVCTARNATTCVCVSHVYVGRECQSGPFATHKHTGIYMYIPKHAHTHTRTHTHIYIIYIYRYIYIHTHLFICPAVTHHTDTPHRKQHHERLPNFIIHTRTPDLLYEDGIRLTQHVQLQICKYGCGRDDIHIYLLLAWCTHSHTTYTHTYIHKCIYLFTHKHTYIKVHTCSLVTSLRMRIARPGPGKGCLIRDEFSMPSARPNARTFEYIAAGVPGVGCTRVA